MAERSLDIIFDQITKEMDRQLGSIQPLDTKASIIAGFDGAVLVAVLGVLGQIQDLLRIAAAVWRPWILPALLSLGVVLVLGSLFCAIHGYWIGTYVGPLDPGKAFRELCNQPSEQTKLDLVGNWISAHEQNLEAIRAKARWVSAAITCFGLALIPFAIGIVLSLATFCIDP